MAEKLKYDKSDIIFLDDEGLKRYQAELLKMISDVFKFFVFFDISGRLTKMFSTCYADLEETGNK